MGRTYSAILAAGGSSLRFGANKIKEKVGGKALLSHSLDVFDADEMCAEMIIAASPATQEWIESNPLVFSSSKMRIVSGGESRAESVANAARVAKSDILVIHDAARPNFGEALLTRVLHEVKPGHGAVPALAAADSIARAQDGAVTEYMARDGAFTIQTPQAFERESYLRALEQAGDELASFPDDGSLYLAAGNSVGIVAGSTGNIKLTSPDDLTLLLKLMGGNERKSKDKYGGLGW